MKEMKIKLYLSIGGHIYLLLGTTYNQNMSEKMIFIVTCACKIRNICLLYDCQ